MLNEKSFVKRKFLKNLNNAPDKLEKKHSQIGNLGEITR